MPSNQTPNYALNQWSKDDRVLMDDFNADNAKIDGALAAQAVLLAGLEARKGNCRVEFYSYVGTGEYGPEHPTVIPYSRKPLFIAVFGANQCMLDSPRLPRYVLLANDARQNPNTHYSTWTDHQISFYSDTSSSPSYIVDNAMAQMNQNSVPYFVVLLSAEGE